MRNEIEKRQRTANEDAFAFLGSMGGMMRRGSRTQAQEVARLLQNAARSDSPVLEAREIAAAARAWADAFDKNPAFAARLASRVIDGESTKLQARLDMPVPVQPQRRAAAPKPRGP